MSGANTTNVWQTLHHLPTKGQRSSMWVREILPRDYSIAIERTRRAGLHRSSQILIYLRLQSVAR